MTTDFSHISSPTNIWLNSQQFRQVFDQYYVTMCTFANQYTGDKDLSADIVQDCFVKLWQIRRDFSLPYQVKAFLYTAVRNKALNEIDRAKTVIEYAQKESVRVDENIFFHDTIIEEETYRIISEAVEQLPRQMKAIIQLALDGKKNVEIAAELHISTETVHSLKKIAYKKLRYYLKSYYYIFILLLP